MRLPGTVNSKNGERHEVRVLNGRSDLQYDYAELEKLVAATAAPLLYRKDAKAAELGDSAGGDTRGNGAGANADNPFLAFAGANPAPLNVEQMLAAMIYLGEGNHGNAHETLLRCSASRPRRRSSCELRLRRLFLRKTPLPGAI
jgi:hypothetical protein